MKVVKLHFNLEAPGFSRSTEVLRALVNLELSLLGIGHYSADQFSELIESLDEVYIHGEFNDAIRRSQNKYFERMLEKKGMEKSEDMKKNIKDIHESDVSPRQKMLNQAKYIVTQLNNIRKEELEKRSSQAETGDQSPRPKVMRYEDNFGPNMDEFNEVLTRGIGKTEGDTARSKLINFLCLTIEKNPLDDHDYEPRREIYNQIVLLNNLEPGNTGLPKTTPIINQVNFIKNPHCGLVQGEDGNYYEVCP